MAEMDEAEIREMMATGLVLVMKEIEEFDDGKINRIWGELVSLHKRGFWSRIDCRIGSGRESFVYHATGPEHTELAIKVFTCPSLDLRSRFDCNYYDYAPLCVGFSSRPHSELFAYEMMKLFGISCPSPVVNRNRVVITEFIGKDGVPAPTLYVASSQLSKAQLCECLRSDLFLTQFFKIIRIMRTLCLKCELVHGDLSESNVLYHQGHLYVIDASQSVSTEHIWAPTLLNNDCCRVLKFFETHGVPVMPAHVLYRLVSDKSITDESFNSFLEEIPLDTSAMKKWIKLIEETPADTVLPEYKVSVAQMKVQKKAVIAEFRGEVYNPLCDSGPDIEEYLKAQAELLGYEYKPSSSTGDYESGGSSAVVRRKRERESPSLPPPGEEEAEDSSSLQGIQDA